MITDKIVIIALSIFVLVFLIIKFVKNNVKKNLIILPVQAFFLGAYFMLTIFNAKINIVYDIISTIFMVFIPSFFAILQYNNIQIREKVLMLRLDLNYMYKNYDKVIFFCNRFLSRNVVSSRILYMLGKAYNYKKDFINARESFIRAVDVNKRDYKSYFELGRILNDTNKIETAIIMYNNCLRIKPDYFEAAESLSMLYCSLEKYDEALSIYRDILRYHPNSVESYYNMAVIYTELRRLDEAKEAFSKAAEIRPKLYGAHYNIGQIYYLKGDYNNAIEYFNKARSSTMYGAKAYYNLAKVYMARNEREKAISHLEYSMELEPQFITEAQNEMIFNGINEFIQNYINSKIENAENINDPNEKMEKRKAMEKIIEKDLERERIEKERIQKKEKLEALNK